MSTTIVSVAVFKKIYKKLKAWRQQPVEGEYPYVYLDGILLKRTWAGEVRIPEQSCHRFQSKAAALINLG